jgi:hypothetical protein
MYQFRTPALRQRGILFDNLGKRARSVGGSFAKSMFWSNPLRRSWAALEKAREIGAETQRERD